MSKTKTTIHASLPEFGDDILFDYNEIIKQCMRTHGGFLKLLGYFQINRLKIRPTKHQCIMIKKTFTKFCVQVPELKLLEYLFIANNSDYVVSSCNDEKEIEDVYLSMFKPACIASPYADPALREPSKPLQPFNIVEILDSNVHHFSNDLKSKMINELFIKVDKHEDRECIFRFMVEIMKLLHSVGNSSTDDNGSTGGIDDEILKKQEIKIKELIKLPSFKEILYISTTYSLIDTDGNSNHYKITFNKGYLSFEIADWIIQSFGDQVMDSDIYINLLILIASSSNRNDQLHFVNKYQNQIINGINNDTSIVYPLPEYDGKLRKEFEQIMSIIIKSNQFQIKEFLTFVHKFDLKPLFKDWLTFDVLVDVLVELYSGSCSGLKLVKQSDLNKFISKHFNDRRIVISNDDENTATIQRHKALSIFQINEDKFIHKLDQDEYALLEIYYSNFRILFSNLPNDTDYAILVLFSNFSTSPIKRSFLSDKIEYLIEICNLNIINNWILPNFNDECMRSKTYKLKSSSVNLQSIGKQLSSVLIDEIFKQYLNNNSTSMYQKLQLSLVSKKSFQRVKSLMNNSMDVPITISSLKFTPDYCDGKYSLYDSGSIRYLNFLKLMSQYSEQAKRIVFSILSKCKSIEILQLSYSDVGKVFGQQFDKFKILFNWINWYNSSNGGKFKKLIVQIEELKSLREIQEIQSKNSDIDISIQLCLHKAISKADKSSIEFNKFNITNLDIPIGTYFCHGLLKINGISTIKNLKLSINFRVNPVSEETMIKYFKKYSKNWINQQDGSTSLSNLKTLELVISVDPNETSGSFRFYKELFGYLGSKVSSNLKEIIISFKSNSFNNNSNIGMIFKLISDNPQFYSVSQISIPIFYSNSIVHSLNKLSTTYSFIQQPLNYNRIDSIEFIRNVKPDEQEKKVCQIKNNKRKFDEIDKQHEQKEEEVIDFNTDSKEEDGDNL